MPGTWLTRIARRLTREETFDRLVSPAIADMQREAAHGMLLRTRHYGAMAIILACALLRDFHASLALAFDADASRRIWTRAAMWSLAAGSLSWFLMYTVTARQLIEWQVDASTARLVLDGVIFQSWGPAFTVGAIVAAYQLKRRDPAGSRAVVAAAAAFLATTLVMSYVSINLQQPARHAMDQIAIARFSLPSSVTRPPIPWQIVGSVVQMAPFLWLGAVLARHRGWPLALGATAILATYTSLLVTGGGFRLVAMLVRAVPLLEPVLFGTFSIPHNALVLIAAIQLWRMLDSRIWTHGAAPGH